MSVTVIIYYRKIQRQSFGKSAFALSHLGNVSTCLVQSAIKADAELVETETGSEDSRF